MTGQEPRLRASDSDRQATVDLLAEHFTAGRLTATEYDERVRCAYASTYQDELPTLLADLPDDRIDGRAGAGSWGWYGDGQSWGAADHPASSDGPRWAGDGSRWSGDEAGGPRGSGWPGRNAGYGAAGGWRGRPGGRRHRPPLAVLPVLLVVLLVIVLSHGFVLVPLVWIAVAMLVLGPHRRGGCGRRIGPHSAR